MRCIYCADSRGQLSLSEEHIWPKALGGMYTPAEFRTEAVCHRCNSLAGQFVDAPFIKTFFIASERMTASQEYLDVNRPEEAALMYMGFDQSFLSPDHVCERWIGPAGEHIYHIHEKDDSRWQTVAGGDMIKRHHQPGRLYITMTSPTDYWVLTALISVSASFSSASRRCLTRISGIPDRYMGFFYPDDPFTSQQEKEEVAWIDAKSDATSVLAHLPMQVDFADRFLAKLAIGFAHTLLGPSASAAGTYSDELRKMLWSKTLSEREALIVHGSGFFGDELRDMNRFLHWPGVWSFYFSQLGRFFGMVLVTPSGRSLAMTLSDDPSCWRLDLPRVLRQGALYNVVPQRRHTFGPISLVDCISHRNGRRKHPEITQLEQWRSGLNALPLKMTSVEVQGIGRNFQ